MYYFIQKVVISSKSKWDMFYGFLCVCVALYGDIQEAGLYVVLPQLCLVMDYGRGIVGENQSQVTIYEF